CIDLARDIAHCGACTTACDSTQFCGTAGCSMVSFTNICANLQRTEITDDLGLDDDGANAMQVALGAQCAPPPSPSTISQTAAGPTNATTGQPVAGASNLLVTAGGYFVNKLVGYLDSIGATPVYLTSSGADLHYTARSAAADGGSTILKT